MTLADVKDLTVPRPLISPWLRFVEPKPASIATDLRKAA